MNTNGKLIVAFLAGIAAGAAAGLLFAPYKGSETRRKINEGARDLSDNILEKIEESFDAVTSMAGKIYGSSKEEVTGRLHTGKIIKK